jgi:hypothetical protein
VPVPSPSHEGLHSGTRSSESNCRHFLLAFGNLPFLERTAHTGIAHFMPYLDQSQPRRRAERVRFEEATPVVLRFPDGRRSSGQLQVISVTGGLLCLSPPIQQGAVVKLMFLARTGSVLGSVQMLSPVAWDRQPFRFVAIHEDDQSRLHAAIQMSLEQSRRDNEQRSREREHLEKFTAW